ncbi:hypothetical protein PGH07_09230 [Sulfurovum sp. zt1-1]|uniref:Uncharacterized protein n=1 Tax=Sulfurovum zhangzhouensis TaxID=3019067 RepID=A0ABT7R0R1_9BACT|nr:hypothetical protein [Sulfurovum zhangzhouensis]MDM5272364.1 hypothetical protein [Sulfurovum zhangzhouensis]
MKFIIDLIEDIRVEIGNNPDFTINAMLLKEDVNDPQKLIYGGEAGLNSFTLDEAGRKLMIKFNGSTEILTIGELIKHILIYDMDKMMYEARLNINHQHNDIEVLGFGKSIEEKKYFIFIKL